jgi:hypothetical protein
MGFANRAAPLQNREVGRHVRGREERMHRLGWRMRVLRREMHDERWRLSRRNRGRGRSSSRG